MRGCRVAFFILPALSRLSVPYRPRVNLIWHTEPQYAGNMKKATQYPYITFLALILKSYRLVFQKSNHFNKVDILFRCHQTQLNETIILQI